MDAGGQALLRDPPFPGASPGRKWLICDYRISPPFDPERPTLMETLRDELDRRGLTPADTIYNTVLLRTQADQNGPSISRMGFFLVPIC